MPELPEVETVRRGLDPYVTGARIDKVTLNRKDLRFAFPEGFKTALEGATIESTGRRAKYLLFRLSTGKTWLSHLGMTGFIASRISSSRILRAITNPTRTGSTTIWCWN